MCETIINLTAILVSRELEDFFSEYHQESPFGILFSRPYFRNRLIAKILSQIPNRHVVVGDTETLANHSDYLLSCLEEKLTIEQLIKQSIPAILTANQEQVGDILVREKGKTNPCLIWD